MGVVDQRLGFGKMRVICTDRKIRVCRIPGKFRRKLWINSGAYVLVKPWEMQGEEKGDIIYKYTKHQVYVLRKKGLLSGLEG